MAAQLSGLHPQTLRQYDRLGLVSPDRTAGRGRRYSARDIELLRQVQQLSQDEGINLAGIKRIIELENQVAALQSRVAELSAAVDGAAAAMQQREAAGARLVPPRPGPVPGGPADERAGGVAAQPQAPVDGLDAPTRVRPAADGCGRMATEVAQSDSRSAAAVGPSGRAGSQRSGQRACSRIPDWAMR